MGLDTCSNKIRRCLSICLFFRAPLGGLQENILATARYAINAGWSVSVLCPPGPFLEQYVSVLPCEAIPVEYDSPASVQAAKITLQQADIIHAHPGASRILALDAAKVSGTPVVLTIHGAWFDGIQQYAHRLASIVCVSPAVYHAVSQLCISKSDHIYYIPNGIDFSIFGAVESDVSVPRHVVVCSRLDADKRVLIDTLIGIWEAQAKCGNRSIHYTVAGKGTLQHELETAAQKNGIKVCFIGWLDRVALSRLYGTAAAVIASGRAALEALSRGKPTLALASTGVAEIFHADQLSNAAYSNFGGYGAQPTESFDVLFERLRVVASALNPSFSADMSEFLRTHYDNSVVNKQLLDLYESVLISNSALIN